MFSQGMSYYSAILCSGLKTNNDIAATSQQVTEIPSILFICAAIQCACAGCPYLERIREWKYECRFQDEKHTSWKRKKNKRKKIQTKETLSRKNLDPCSQLISMYKQAHAECVYTKCVNRK